MLILLGFPFFKCFLSLVYDVINLLLPQFFTALIFSIFAEDLKLILFLRLFKFEVSFTHLRSYSCNNSKMFIHKIPFYQYIFKFNVMLQVILLRYLYFSQLIALQKLGINLLFVLLFRYMKKVM